MKRLFSKINALYLHIQYRHIVGLGLLVAVLTATMEVLRGRCCNFMIFKLSTLDFWNGISPYGEEWFRHGYDYFLYLPTFNLLFAPFAFTPTWVGAVAWNVTLFTLFAYAIKEMPRLSERNKCSLLLYLLPLLGAGLLSFQYNLFVGAMYLWTFTLLERGKPLLAITLTMLSAVTKVYGLFALALLLFYPKLGRNVLFAVCIGAILFVLPVVNSSLDTLSLYQEWFETITSHRGSRMWENFFGIKLLFGPQGGGAYMQPIQWGTLICLAIAALVQARRWSDFHFRAGYLAIITGWVILFGNSSEVHTYVISLAGYLYWYYTLPQKGLVDRISYWVAFVVMVWIPIDLLFPAKISRFLLIEHNLTAITFTLIWGWIIWRTLFTPCSTEKVKESLAPEE